LRRLLLHPDCFLDPIDKTVPDRFRLGDRWRRSRLWFGLRYSNALTGPLEELATGRAERFVVVVLVPAILADDQLLVTSTGSFT
jgi:hypothetical protein